MTDKEYCENVRKLLDIVIMQCARISVDIGLINDLGIETNERLARFEDGE